MLLFALLMQAVAPVCPANYVIMCVPPPVPPLPMVEKWKADMVTWGDVHCLKAQTSPTYDQRLATTYYDAVKVYGDILAFTGETKWQACLDANLKTYRDEYVMRSDLKGGVPGYWNFTTGLRRHFDKTGDVKSKDAVLALASRAAFCSDSTPASSTSEPGLAREVGYCLNAKNDAEALGAARTTYHDLMVNQALQHLDKWFISKTYRAPVPFSLVPAAAGLYYVQPFMVAIETRALLNENKIRPDSRILPAVKAALDYLTRRAWDASRKAFFYENYAADAEAPWQGVTAGAPDLNQLIAAAFFDYATASGDVTYRDKSDEIFAGGAAAAYLGGPKQYNQNYEWSVDHVRQRQ